MTSPDSPPLAHRPEASIWRRAAARVLDALTVFAALWALAVMQILWLFNDLSREVAPDPWGRAFLPTLLFVVCLIAFEAFFVKANHGQTPGMDVCRIRVIRLDGTHPSTGDCLRRALPGALPWAIPPIWLGGALVATTGIPAALTRSRRSVQDLVARTRVVPYDRVSEDPDCPPTPKVFRRRRLVQVEHSTRSTP